MTDTKNKNSNKEMWGCVGTIGAALIAGTIALIIALPTLVPFFANPLPTPSLVNQVPSLGITQQPTFQPSATVEIALATSVSPSVATQENQCQWLQNNFPQTSDEVKQQFKLPNTATIQFIYELCPRSANAFAFKSTSVIELSVPSGGCIDSWSGFTTYVGDVGTPVSDGNGGWRVYKGVVRAPEMTYRIMGCK